MKTITFTFLGFLVCNTLMCFGQAGSLDITFDGDGKTTTGFRKLSYCPGQSMALQTDGKIVVAGYVNKDDATSDFMVVRYNANGTTDNSFSEDGKVITAVGSSADAASGVAIQGDGKIVVAGNSFNGINNDFAVVRYNSNGTLDNTFSNDGKVITAIGEHDVARSVVIQQDGKIVVAGTTTTNNTSDFAVVRYNTNGTLDNTFSSDGKVTLDFANTEDEANAVTIQADGKIVVAGNSRSANYADFTLARYNPNGTLDNSFNGNGKIMTIVGNSSSCAYAIAIQNDGKLVTAGYRFKENTNVTGDFALVRYNANGSPDNSFGINGQFILDFGGTYDQAHSIALQQDGKIIAGGISDNKFAVIRCMPDGSLDNMFNENGVGAAINIADVASIHSVAVQPNGKIVAAGNCLNNDGMQSSAFEIVRYDTNGKPDNSFDSDGIVTTSFFEGSPNKDNGRSIAIQPDGRIVVAGSSSNSSGSYLVMARYNTNGSRDLQFSNSFPQHDISVASIAIQPDGKIIAAGQIFNGSNYDFAVIRFNPDGTADKSFGTDGIVATAIGTGHDYGQSVKIQADGKIVVAGYAYITSGYDFAVVRYNTNGTPDNFFSLDGIVTAKVLSKNDYGRSLAIQADGKIVVAGSSFNGSYDDFTMVRFNANGTLDNGFGSGGMVKTDMAGKSDNARSVVVQSNGKIVVTGYAQNGSNSDFAVARYNANGTLDNSFSGDGIELTTIDGTSQDYAVGAVVQPDGKIIVAGYSYNALYANYDFALVRYTASGIPDNGFGTAGRILTNFNSPNDVAAAVVLQADGKIVVAGSTSIGTDFDFAVARYNTATPLTGIAARSETNSSANMLQHGHENMMSRTALQSIKILPNPITSKASISFLLAEKGLVHIELLDASGNTIKVIQHGVLPAGAINLDFYRENLSSGIYFLKVTTDGDQATTSILID